MSRAITISRAESDSGMRNTIFGQCLGLIPNQALFGGGIIILMMVSLTGDPLLAVLAFNSAYIPSIATLLTAIFAHPRSPKAFMLRQWARAACIMVAIGFILIFGSSNWAAMAFIVAIYLYQIFAGSGGTYWFPVLQDFIPEEQRGRFFARMRAAWTMVSLIVVVIISRLIGPDTSQQRFGEMMLIFGLLYLGRNAFIARLPELPASVREPNGRPPFREVWSTVMKNRKFLAYLAYIGIFSFVVGSFKPILVLYMKQQLALQDSQNVLISIIGSAGAFVAFLFCGFFVDKVGSRRVFGFAHFLISLLMLGLAFLPHDSSLLILGLVAANILVQGMIASHGVASTSYLFFLMSGPARAVFTAINALMMSMTALLAASVGGLLTKIYAGATFGWFGHTISIYQIIFFSTGAALMLTLPLISLIASGRYQLRVRTQNMP